MEAGRLWLMENDTTTMSQYEAVEFPLALSNLVWGVPGFWKLGFSSREKLLEIRINWTVVDPANPLDMLAQNVLTPAQLRRHAMLDDFSLHKFAWQYFHAFLNRAYNMDTWRLLARNMLVGTPPIEVAIVLQDGSSTIASITKSLWRRQFALRPFEWWITKALNMWLEDLAEAGIDLEEYMMWEIFESRDSHPVQEDDENLNSDTGWETDEETDGESYERFDNETDDETNEDYEKSGDESNGETNQDSDEGFFANRNEAMRAITTASLKSMKGVRIPESGPSLVMLESGQAFGDWHFLWDPCVEELVGEFWAGLEYSHMKIPGAWVDNDESNEENRGSVCQIRCFDHCGNVCCHLRRWRDEQRGFDVDAGQRPSRVRGMTKCGDCV